MMATCMDGLVYPDRTVHTGLWNTRMFIAWQELFPITKKAENWCFITTWILDDLKDYVKISYELTQDGLVISKGILPEFSVAPHGEGKQT